MTTQNPIGIDTALHRISDYRREGQEALLKAEQDRWSVIKVERSRIPKGAKLVEAYETETEFIVMGDPSEDEHLPEDQQHNCDAMGCGSLGPHVIARFKKC